MKLVLLSGGAGKRLWPLSDDKASKQFMELFEFKGNRESMVQRVYRIIQETGLLHNSYIATNNSQEEILKKQLGEEVNIILEPSRRDTFPAIALSSTYLRDIEKVSLDEVIVFSPVDPFIDVAFFEHIKKMEDILKRSKANILLMGVKPKFPANKYGYIMVDDKSCKENDYLNVKAFVEKPSVETAETLVKQNALWNCGVFAFKLGYLLKLLEECNLPTSYLDIRKNYNLLPKISFDYQVLEKEKRIIVSSFDGLWKDLGTWGDLTDEIPTKIMGYGLMDKNVERSHIINKLQLPVLISGCSDIIVVSSVNGILVTQKNSNSELKSLLMELDDKDNNKEKEEILDYSRSDESLVTVTKKIKITESKPLYSRNDDNIQRIYTVLKGNAEVTLNGETRIITCGDVIKMYPNDQYVIIAKSITYLIEVLIKQENIV